MPPPVCIKFDIQPPLLSWCHFVLCPPLIFQPPPPPHPLQVIIAQSLIIHSSKRFHFRAHHGAKTNLLNLQHAIIPALHCNDPLIKGWQINLRVSRPLLSCTICLKLPLPVIQCLGNRLYLVLRNSQSSFPLTAYFSILSELGLHLLKLPMHRDEEDELDSDAR